MAGAMELIQDGMSSKLKEECDGHVCMCLYLFVITLIDEIE
jgi:hypothetical protein